MKYNCVKQHDNTDCGAACIATICRQQGYNISISKIREIDAKSKGLDNPNTGSGELMKELIFYILH